MSNNLGIHEYVIGGMYDSWGEVLVQDLAVYNKAFGDTLTFSDTSGTIVLTQDQSNNAAFRFDGSGPSTVTVHVKDNIGRFWFVNNARASGAVAFRCAAGGSTVTLAAGDRRMIYSDGVNVIDLTLATLAISSVSGLQASLDAKVALAGGTMLGALTLSGDPASSLHAAPKQYVDAAITAIKGGVAAQGDTLAELYALIADTDLAAIAALTTTAYGRSLLTAVDATAARTLLEMAPQVVTASPSSNQNNYAITGVVEKASKKTILVLTPTISLKFTGIDTTGWETGKELVIQNGTSEAGADGRLIILELNSASSLAANRFGSMKRHVPVMLMPGDEVNLRFDGTNLRVLNQVTAEGGSTVGFSTFAFNAGLLGQSVTGGTGAAVTRGSGDDDNGHSVSVSHLETGTTSTGRATDRLTYEFGVQGGVGALLYLSAIRLVQLATVAQEFDARSGFNDGSGNSGIPADGVYWIYDRNISANWQCRATFNSTHTTIDSGLVASDGQNYIRLGVFMNGDASRAEYFYSTDMGQTWIFVATAATTNLPAARTFGVETGITKSAGTTSVHMAVRSQGYRCLNWS